MYVFYDIHKKKLGKVYARSHLSAAFKSYKKMVKIHPRKYMVLSDIIVRKVGIKRSHHYFLKLVSIKNKPCEYLVKLCYYGHLHL